MGGKFAPKWEIITATVVIIQRTKFSRIWGCLVPVTPLNVPQTGWDTPNLVGAEWHQKEEICTSQPLPLSPFTPSDQMYPNVDNIDSIAVFNIKLDSSCEKRY